MLLEKASKQDIADISKILTPKLIKEPLFMFFCQDINIRKEFIDAYLYYYIYEWSRYDKLLYHEDAKCLISLVDPDTFAYKFKGKGARGLKKFRDSSTVFAHRENVSDIIDIVIPPTKESMVMTVYGSYEEDLVELNQLIDEAIDMAINNDLVLIYETFSKKLIGLFERKGFAIASQKQFLNTQFIETVMTFNQ